MHQQRKTANPLVGTTPKSHQRPQWGSVHNTQLMSRCTYTAHIYKPVQNADLMASMALFSVWAHDVKGPGYGS